MEIDVSGCKYWQMAHCPEGYTCKYNCCDCYYKQLQQLMQENELLKNERTIDLRNQLEKLKAENEELKKLNEQLITYYPQENNELLKVKLENEELKKEKDKYYQMTLDDEIQLNNLYQELQKESELGHKAICEEMDSFFEAMKLQKVLDEIEEIVNFMSTIVNCDNAYYCNDKLNEILQLIKQAKEG